MDGNKKPEMIPKDQIPKDFDYEWILADLEPTYPGSKRMHATEKWLMDTRSQGWVQIYKSRYPGVYPICDDGYIFIDGYFLCERPSELSNPEGFKRWSVGRSLSRIR